MVGWDPARSYALEIEAGATPALTAQAVRSPI
jgi:hypothetical protein